MHFNYDSSFEKYEDGDVSRTQRQLAKITQDLNGKRVGKPKHVQNYFGLAKS